MDISSWEQHLANEKQRYIDSQIGKDDEYVYLHNTFIWGRRRTCRLRSSPPTVSTARTDYLQTISSHPIGHRHDTSWRHSFWGHSLIFFNNSVCKRGNATQKTKKKSRSEVCKKYPVWRHSLIFFNNSVCKKGNVTQKAKNNTRPATIMVHARRLTLGELTTALNRVKVGGWVEVECDYSVNKCSAGGIGCVTTVMDVGSDTSSTDEDSCKTFVDVHYLLTIQRKRKLALTAWQWLPCLSGEPKARCVGGQRKWRQEKRHSQSS